MIQRLKRNGRRDKVGSCHLCNKNPEPHRSCLRQHWLRFWVSFQYCVLLKCYSEISCGGLGQLYVTFRFTSGYQGRWMYGGPQPIHLHCHSSRHEISCTAIYSLWLNFLLPKQPIRNINGQKQFYNKTVCVLYHSHIILNFCSIFA